MKFEIEPKEELERTFKECEYMIRYVDFNEVNEKELRKICGNFYQEMRDFSNKYRQKEYVLRRKPVRVDYDKYTSEECFCCHKKITNSDPVYQAVFTDITSIDWYVPYITTVCHDCAYSFGMGVDEKDHKSD